MEIDKLEKIDKLISKYKESLDKHRTNTKFGQKLYDSYIEELNDYGNRLKIRHEETDPTIIMSYIMTDVDGYKFVPNYPLFGHEYFMTNMDSIIDELNINVSDDSYTRQNRATIRISDENDTYKIFESDFLKNIIKGKVDNFKNITMIKASVRPDSSEILTSKKEVVIDIYLN
jgi:hypothetical protein